MRTGKALLRVLLGFAAGTLAETTLFQNAPSLQLRMLWERFSGFLIIASIVAFFPRHRSLLRPALGRDVRVIAWSFLVLGALAMVQLGLIIDRALTAIYAGKLLVYAAHAAWVWPDLGRDSAIALGLGLVFFLPSIVLGIRACRVLDGVASPAELARYAPLASSWLLLAVVSAIALVRPFSSETVNLTLRLSRSIVFLDSENVRAGVLIIFALVAMGLTVHARRLRDAPFVRPSETVLARPRALEIALLVILGSAGGSLATALSWRGYESLGTIRARFLLSLLGVMSFALAVDFTRRALLRRSDETTIKLVASARVAGRAAGCAVLASAIFYGWRFPWLAEVEQASLSETQVTVLGVVTGALLLFRGERSAHGDLQKIRSAEAIAFAGLIAIALLLVTTTNATVSMADHAAFALVGPLPSCAPGIAPRSVAAFVLAVLAAHAFVVWLLLRRNVEPEEQTTEVDVSADGVNVD